MEKPVIIFGANPIGKAALEIFESNQVVVYGFLDENSKLHNTEINHVSVLGDPSDRGFLKLIGQKCEAFVATDDDKIRKAQTELLMEERKIMPVNAVHPSAILAKSSAIGHGNFINAAVVMGAFTTIGQHNLIHTRAILEQEVTVGDFVQIGAGSIVNSGVTIGNHVFIGSGVTIVSGVTIGDHARIGAGSLVVGDVAKKTTVFGNPAVKIEK
ncbi:MAG: acetyltransferase [Cyclobacteriaceae bacterium]|nr:acetyltransferase [Cyclobacteriaceae bacterium]